MKKKKSEVLRVYLSHTLIDSWKYFLLSSLSLSLALPLPDMMSVRPHPLLSFAAMIAAQPANHTAQSRPNQHKHKQTNKVKELRSIFIQSKRSHNCTTTYFLFSLSQKNKKKPPFLLRNPVTVCSWKSVPVRLFCLSFDKSIQNGISICLCSVWFSSRAAHGATVRALRTLLMFVMNLSALLNTTTTRKFAASSSIVDARNRCA